LQVSPERPLTESAMRPVTVLPSAEPHTQRQRITGSFVS
jgi:hypothetical protein